MSSDDNSHNLWQIRKNGSRDFTMGAHGLFVKDQRPPTARLCTGSPVHRLEAQWARTGCDAAVQAAAQPGQAGSWAGGGVWPDVGPMVRRQGPTGASGAICKEKILDVLEQFRATLSDTEEYIAIKEHYRTF